MSKRLFQITDKYYAFDFIVFNPFNIQYNLFVTSNSRFPDRQTKMARNGVAFTSHLPAKNLAAHQTNAHTTRRFTFTYDDLYNCLYRHNEPQLIDIEAFKAQKKASQADGERPKEPTSKSTAE